MKVSLDSKAELYLKSKGIDTFTLFLRSTGGGWCGFIQVPEVAYKVPEVPEGYLKQDINGITIYIQKMATQGAEHIEFKVKGFWVFKSLVAEGVKFPKI